MKYRLLSKTSGETKYLFVFEPGDEVLSQLTGFAESQEVQCARFQAIGAFSKARIAFFDLETKQYEEMAIEEQVEVMSLIGNIAIFDKKPKLHAHVVVGKRDGTAHG